VADDVALGLGAVGEAEALDDDAEDAALVHGPAPRGLEVAVGGAHRP
jgi:hypothetical protein